MSVSIAAEIFKAYDIRGIVDVTLTEEAVYHIGLAIADVHKCHDVFRVFSVIHGR